jgi:hypothetical protein
MCTDSGMSDLSAGLVHEFLLALDRAGFSAGDIECIANSTHDAYYNKLLRCLQTEVKIIRGVDPKRDYGPSARHVDHDLYYEKFLKRFLALGLTKALMQRIVSSENAELGVFMRQQFHYLYDIINPMVVVSRTDVKVPDDLDFEVKYTFRLYQELELSLVNEDTMFKCITEQSNPFVIGETYEASIFKYYHQDHYGEPTYDTILFKAAAKIQKYTSLVSGGIFGLALVRGSLPAITSSMLASGAFTPPKDKQLLEPQNLESRATFMFCGDDLKSDPGLENGCVPTIGIGDIKNVENWDITKTSLNVNIDPFERQSRDLKKSVNHGRYFVFFEKK